MDMPCIRQLKGFQEVFMTIESQLQRFLYDNFIFDEQIKIERNASLLENGIVDSTGILELIMFIEETFQIEVQDDEVIPQNLDSIANLINFINFKLQSADND